MVTQQIAVNLAKNFVQEVIAAGVPLKKAILFGSYAKNLQHEYSDFDICLVADSFIGFGYEDWQQFIRVLTKDEYLLVQPKTYSTEDYLENFPFTEEINATGIILFDNLTEEKTKALAV